MVGRSKSDFLAFLDWLGAKGLLPTNTAQARKAVANKVLAALEPSELDDITALDIDEVMFRFTNKFGKNYTPDSARTYRSRFETSVADFKSYCENPVGFKPAGRPRLTAKNGEDTSQGKLKIRVKPRPVQVKGVGSDPAPREVGRPSTGNVVPVQIRENLTVSVGPIPFDFTAAEARRVANVILAMAITD